MRGVLTGTGTAHPKKVAHAMHFHFWYFFFHYL